MRLNIIFISVLASLLLACLPATAYGNTEPLTVVGEEKIQVLAKEKKPVLTEEEKHIAQWQSIKECFRCHEMSEQVISQQPRRRQKKHRKAMKKQRACTDCHNSTDVSCCHDHLFAPIERW